MSKCANPLCPYARLHPTSIELGPMSLLGGGGGCSILLSYTTGPWMVLDVSCADLAKTPVTRVRDGLTGWSKKIVFW